MRKLILAGIVGAVKAREQEGDYPVTPLPATNALEEAILELSSESNSRLENIKAMSGYLDDVAEALGVAKPGTPVEGIGACWKVIGAIQRRNEALLKIAGKMPSIDDTPDTQSRMWEIDRLAKEALQPESV